MNTPIADEVRTHILEIHNLFWQALADRNVDLRFSLCADFVTFIGSGLHEKAADKQEYITINKKGIEQYPKPFKIKILWERISIIDTMAWVESEIEWIQEIAGKDERQLLRNTVILNWFNNKWLIVHVHGSVPDFRLSGNNYITNAETIALNRELEQQVYQRTKDLNQILEDLKSAQSLLIQSEKMASLGELTAGIAHEIQNPLNFVNNFSQVNTELIDELKAGLANGDQQAAIEIADNIRENEQKINHHGNRADAIVKAMLQHSRSSAGQKEPTDINALADEYLRLSYHGMRAKDAKDATNKMFSEGIPVANATMETNFAPELSSAAGKINIIPQDIGRVLLNLFNNAFYAVAEKAKKHFPEKGQPEYRPKISVSTSAAKSPSPKEVPGTGNLGVVISIRDNGNGIPQNIIDKIFQPFFTTKASGQGTGLGLSLSYDIIKAHGGEIKVETKENEYTDFLIFLPV
ncbi:MAG: ATP-binding protein [Bacteroidota bacterium]|nr:ATP-binding protein [Bacteroidota bacterium]